MIGKLIEIGTFLMLMAGLGICWISYFQSENRNILLESESINAREGIKT